MEIQTMGSNRSDQPPHLQPLRRQTSWFGLSLNEVENQLGDVAKPLGQMNLDEFLKNAWTAEADQSNAMDANNLPSTSSLQKEAGLTSAKPFNSKPVDEVWRNVQQGEKMKNIDDARVHEGEPTLGRITLEDFLVKAGLVEEASSRPVNGASHSIDTMSDIGTPCRKSDSADAIEKILDRRLKRKIKNRESAARSRARKQAYHNELVSKVSRLEEENLKLKKEKELETILPWESAPVTRYQLRRTSSS